MEVFRLAVLELPDWLTWDLVFRIMDSKAFSAIYWSAAAIVAIIGFLARMRYRDRNLKKLLNDYVEKATRGEGKERQSVKLVIGTAIDKARGRAATGRNAAQFDASDVFQNAARFFAQSQPQVAIDLLRREAANCEATIEYALHQVRAARERAATAYLEIGSMLREQARGTEALTAFTDMLKVNPGDTDALRLLGLQCRELGQFDAAERWFGTLLDAVRQDAVASSEIRRELALTYMASGNLPRAENELDEAMLIERGQPSLQGEAVTTELVGVLCGMRKQWKMARRAYAASRSIFAALQDTESVTRIDARSVALESARAAQLAKRKKTDRPKRTSQNDTGDRPTMH